jgi:signal transduction histidine kinase
MARGWSATSRVPLSFATTGDVRPMPPASEVTLFRVAQEALANVAKHAAASRVGLTLSYTEDVVLLDVRDDGVGFHPAQPRTSDSGGFGLTAMRQRLAQVAGTLEVESTPGEGTSVNARIPLTPVGDGG